MNVKTRELHLETGGEGDIINITEKVAQALVEEKVLDGIVTVFVPGSTGALTTIEYEPGLLKDLPDTLERLIPRSWEYEHEKRWHDGNGHSHVKASIIGPSITVPFTGGRLTLGTWQQLVFVELDVRRRDRRLILQFIGE